MKRWLITAMAAALSHMAAGQMHIGAHYAAGISTIYFLPHSGETWRITPCDAGIVWRYYADNERHKYFNIGLQMELNYAARRYRFGDRIVSQSTNDDGMISADTINKKIHSHVIELPVIMQWQIPITTNFGIYINGLVYAAYYARNTAYYADAQGLQQSERFDYKNWNNFDFGIGGGLGVGYKIGSYEIGLDARFMMGISELYPQAPSRYESLPQQFLLSVSIVKSMR